MVARRGQSFSVQLALFTVAVAVVLLAGTGVEGYGDSWHSGNECPGLMGQRNIYDKVVRVCDDCYNTFRDSEVAVNCRRNCFRNNDFTWCLRAVERYHELPDFQTWISRLSAGRK